MNTNCGVPIVLRPLHHPGGSDSADWLRPDSCCCLMPPRSSILSSIMADLSGLVWVGRWRPGPQPKTMSTRVDPKPYPYPGGTVVGTPDPSPEPSLPQPPHAAPEPNVRLYLTMQWVPPLHSHASLSSASEGAGEGAGGGSRGTGCPRQGGRPRARLGGGPLPRWPRPSLAG